ncbi:DUF881 domain-containing protein [Rhodococcus spelaei]|uniref:DUF881 domain-containing protein n=1 Tax=Rhodococcus spelaei TaxID=2546320 RepID=A0A541B802_9NOCA|nr:DUF881 domain-containing protein [Rhodococcus spelaei]TQF68455.1 DUF881 domain-containing protein [Rhodococcus spelaei]
MNEGLDPGYAAAAEDRARGHSLHRPLHASAWCVAGCLVLGLLFGVAYAQASDRAPGVDQVRSEILGKVHDAESRGAKLAATRDDLAARTDALRAQALAGDARGSGVLTRLGAQEQAAGLDPVHGPGIVVTLTDPAARPDLSDQSRPAARAKPVILDRDLQTVVNALWAGGAEAVAVGGVRVGPSVTIRQAGGAMLVDNQPVPSPYVVSAIGPSSRLQTGFVVSDAYLRMSGVAQLYGVGFTVAENDDIRLPGASAREIRSAREVGGQ